MRKKLESETKKSPAFFKVLMKDFHQRLRLPRAFLKHFNGKVPKKCILRISSTIGSSTAGRLSLSSTRINYNDWTIKMEKVSSGRGANYREDVIFSSGWPEFVNHHFLELKDFLRFAYKGKSVFKVEVFGKNGCLKDHHLGNKSNEDDQPMTLPNAIIKIEDEEEEEEEENQIGFLQRHTRYWAHDAQRKASKPWEMMRRKEVRGASTNYKLNLTKKSPAKSTIVAHNAKASGLLHPSKQGATKSAIKLLEPANHFCTITMRPSYVTSAWGYLPIPNRFAETFLRKGSQRLTLKVILDGSWRTWDVLCNSSKCATRIQRAGWLEFVSDNHLEAGDMCIFEIIDQINLVFKVTISRG